MNPKLILVGGFLGAGKTTLLWEAAQRLAQSGRRVGLITNDQAPELVDTALLSRGTPKVSEVSGSCFCCNFPGLIDAMTKLQPEADTLVAEPVGSCTDLSATIVQPLKEKFKDTLSVAPLSVLVDPHKLADILEGGTADLHRSAAYIFRKQLEEADMLVINKADLLSGHDLDKLKSKAAQAFPLSTVFAISAQTGEGLDAWLEAVTEQSESGSHLTDVDYDIYAEGEAVLGWLNATFRIQGPATNWSEFTRNFLGSLGKRFDDTGASVGHVKLMIEAGNDFIVGNLTGKAESLSIRGAHPIGQLGRMTLNARVEMTPDTLANIVREELASCLGELTLTELAWRCLSPGRPEPTYRFDHVVAAG